MKRILFLLCVFFMIVTLFACSDDAGQPLLPTEQPQTTAPILKQGAVTVLFTGDLNEHHSDKNVHGTAGYAALKAYADQLIDDKHNVILIDGGNSLAPSSDDDLWDIMDACGYSVRVPGALELSAGVDGLLSRIKSLKNGSFVSCNLVHIDTNETVFDPYILVEVGSAQVGFVGVSQPGALPLTDEESFKVIGLQDSQALRDVVQRAIDQAMNAGADCVVVVGNLGTSLENSPCTTVEVISGITGLSAWLDCGSGAVLDGDVVVDKDDFEIPVCAPGSNFSYIGKVEIDVESGTAGAKILTEFEKTDRTIRKLIEQYDSKE